MFSTRARYALRVMIDIAQQKSDDYIPLKDIAMRQDLSKKYLEAIAKELVQGEMLEGASGKHGGYKLTRPVDKYSVGEIVELMEGSFAPVACLANDAKECDRKPNCKTLSMWEEFYQIERDFFFGKKLSDLVQ